MQLLNAVIIIVTAIKNSVHCCGTLTTLNVLRASVMEWPMVNAVTSMSNFFQSLTKYRMQSAAIKRI